MDENTPDVLDSEKEEAPVADEPTTDVEPVIDPDTGEPQVDLPSDEQPEFSTEETTEPTTEAEGLSAESRMEDQSIMAFDADGENLVVEDTADEVAEPEQQLTTEDDPLVRRGEEKLDEATEPLPEGATEEEAQPLLDAAKEYTVTSEIVEADEEAIVPENDEQAQADDPVEVDTSAVTRDDGKAVSGPVVLQPPVPNLTESNTTTTNNITNNYNYYQVNNQVIIDNSYQEQRRLQRDGDDYGYDQLGLNRFRETITRPDGTRVITVRDRYGNLLERYRVDPYGNEYTLAYFDQRHYQDLRNWRDPGRGLPPLRLTISFRDYSMDWRYADEDEIYVFFGRPPVEKARRIYSIDEVKRSARIRDSVRRLEIGNLSFASGGAALSKSQVKSLSKLAAAMQRMLDDNPAETFLIEGHTDAVGDDRTNLALSDKRANSVAQILTTYYDIPPENMVPQGYGETYLKVKTQKAEPANRRVTVRRITPLVTPVARR
jgi:outer membrane protein OmpA-like peptidoglycan-associated protein